jgi:ankyrin repeat protein
MEVYINELLVEMLLNKGANVEAVDSSGNTPLHCAAKTGNEIISSTLIRKHANVNVLNNEKVSTYRRISL